MKKLGYLFLLALIVALAACGGQEATPTPIPPTAVPPTAVPPTEIPPTEVPPTEVPPTPEPTLEPTPASPLAAMSHVADAQLIDITWQWERRDPNGAPVDPITVPNPEAYTLLFSADGAFSAQVDCNSAAGQYATASPDAIYMELGPMTMAACPPESLSDAMMLMFGVPQTYRLEENGSVLVLAGVDGGPLDYFRNAAVPAAGEAEIEAIPAETIQMNLQGLANSFSWVVQPGSPVVEGPGFQGMPPHIVLTFDGETPEEAIANNGRRLYIFPAQAYADMYTATGSAIVADQLASLQTLIAQAEGRTEPPTDTMPILPPPMSNMDRWVQFADLNFGVGSGVRYVSDWPFRLDVSPLTNETMSYYYQGLTSNGVFYVSLIWPVSTESLPNTLADVPEEVNAQVANADSYAAYLQTTKDSLNALPTTGWTPDLAALDALVQSLTFPTELTPKLTGTTWQWVSLTTPVEQTAVSDPTRYTITFNDDGTAAIKADCNNVVASYTADGGSLSILPGPSTLAACPEDSLGDQFVANLSNAAIYFFRDGELFMDMFADGGTLRFAAQQTVDLPAPTDGEAVATVIAPDGIFLRTGPGTDYPYVGTAPLGDSGAIIGRSADGQWWVIDAPNLPDGQVWVSATFVEAVNADNVPVVEAPPLSPLLTGTTWQWVSLTTPVEQTAVNDPTRYTITFNTDGTAAIKADCNNVVASYTTDGSALSIVPGPTTLAACPEDSLGDQFVANLSNAAIYFFQDGDLFMDMAFDSGTLRFAAQSAASGGETPEVKLPVSSATGIEFQVVSFGPVGAEQPVLEGTTITAVFGETEVTGSAGCNTYSGAMTAVSDFFTVGPIITTRMACEEATMQQEQAYLAALESLTGYQWGSELVNNTSVVTAGQLFYTLADGTSGVINLLVP